MDFEDSDWTLEAEQPPPAPARRLSLGSLFAGMVLGAIAASGVWWALENSHGHSTAPPAAEPHASAASAGTAEAAMSGASGLAVAPVAAATASAAMTAAPAQVGAASAADNERRALAWARYYKRPAACEGNPSTEQLVECANHFIRSKRQFDADWAAGRR